MHLFAVVTNIRYILARFTKLCVAIYTLPYPKHAVMIEIGLQNII